MTPQPPSPAPPSSLSPSAAAATSDLSFKELAIPAHRATTSVEDRIAAGDRGIGIVGERRVSLDSPCCTAHVDRQLFSAMRGTIDLWSASTDSMNAMDDVASNSDAHMGFTIVAPRVAVRDFSVTSLAEAV
ncbi:MAG: hypothetical protein ACREOJ_10430 [Gemmatimonadaceae bacterium]